MRLKFFPHEPLLRPTEPFDLTKKFNVNFKRKVQRMFKIMKKNKGLGIAANQVGWNASIFVTNVPGDKKRTFINPEIIEVSEDVCLMEEGCLSFPGKFYKILRPKSVKIEYTNMAKQRCSLEADGLLARVILHENDHLRGKTFIERVE